MSDYERVAGGRWELYRKKKNRSWIWIVLAVILVAWIASRDRTASNKTMSGPGASSGVGQEKTGAASGAPGTIKKNGDWYEHYGVQYGNRKVKCASVQPGRFFETAVHHYRFSPDQNSLIVQAMALPKEKGGAGTPGPCFVHETWRYSPSQNHLQIWNYSNQTWIEIGVVMRSGIESTPLPSPPLGWE